MSEELKPLPCPFCGNEYIVVEPCYLTCPSCKADGPMVFDCPPEKATENWNRRAQPVAQAEPARPGRIYTQDDLLEAVKTERYACSIAVWMTLQDALSEDADDKGLDGWMREAEARVKGRLEGVGELAAQPLAEPAAHAYIEGVNIARLKKALTFLGASYDSDEMLAARMAEHVNRLTQCVMRSKAFQADAAPSVAPEPTEPAGSHEMLAQTISALAAIDRALGMPEDGCNSTQRTLNAIELMKCVIRDDAAEIERLRTNPSSVAPEPATDAEPVAWVNGANIKSESISRQRNAGHDTHTWSSCRTDYHDTPLQLVAHPPRPEPLSPSDIGDIVSLAQIAFCLNKQPSFEVALVREVEAAIRGRGEG